MKKPMLEIKNLSIEYFSKKNKVKAVNNISFNVFEGEILGIVGESGSGKSTTAKAILQLNDSKNSKISSGSISYNGEDITGLTHERLRNFRGSDISMIFQNATTALNPVLTIGEQIVETIVSHKLMDKNRAKVRAIELLESVKLTYPEKRLKQYPHELSGGMQQRVMIAIALACKPKIIIADEPTTALDVTTQAEILKLLLHLQSELNVTILFISHDMGVIAQICDRVIVMYQGSIMEQDTVYNIFNNPSHDYTKALLASIPSITENQDRLLTVSDFSIN